MTQTEPKSAEPTARRYRPNETRARVLNAARALFRRKGYGDTSTHEIAQVAGVAEGSIFYHFGAKRQLLAALGTEYAQEKVDAMRRGEQDLSKLEPGILIARAFAYVREHGLTLKPIGLPVGNPELTPFMHANREIVVAFIAKCMHCDRPGGVAGIDDEGRALINASFAYAVVSDALTSVFESQEPADETVVLPETIRFVRAACGFAHIEGVPDPDAPAPTLPEPSDDPSTAHVRP